MKIFDKMERLYNHQKRLIELHKIKILVMEGKDQRNTIEDLDKEIEAWTKSLVKIENELDKG
ncbi:hypothetical protein L1D41_25975 [Vibrio harveyi]|uniref:hypothetical protein n=1 Tax=Vibrio harveyi TaxID=669 RepID=UPI001EFE815A|nr:hypothetical protein [Vibrio harveyi]MCG9613091.1 hypothetical protein [Vibrio harveyi]MCG9671555.1 hypothetical protein [Vibrio harveyi]